jgi:hypothetical protein
VPLSAPLSAGQSEQWKLWWNQLISARSVCSPVLSQSGHKRQALPQNINSLQTLSTERVPFFNHIPIFDFCADILGHHVNCDSLSKNGDLFGILETGVTFAPGLSRDIFSGSTPFP